MIKADELPYRPCVGIALFNHKREVFVGKRIDTPNAWQMPQGGIDPGETPEEAAMRELKEEVGTNNAEIIHVHDTPLCYDLPPHLLGKLFNGRYRGQEQIWIAARFLGNDNDIDIYAHRYPEFDAWQWVGFDDILDLIVPFKRQTYQEVIKAFKDIAF